MRSKGGYAVWIEAGYSLFAKEGYDGMQVERLAKSLSLNKSGFYHFFGDRGSYFEELMKHHVSEMKSFCSAVLECKEIDPDYIFLMLQHSHRILVDIQLVRSRQVKLFHDTSIVTKEMVTASVLPVWMKYTGLEDHPQLASRCFEIISDMMYSRISSNNFTFDAIHEVFNEGKAVIAEIIRTQNFNPSFLRHS